MYHSHLAIGLLLSVLSLSASSNLENKLTERVLQQQILRLLQHLEDITSSQTTILNNHKLQTCKKKNQQPSMQPRLKIFRDCNELYQNGYTINGVYMIQIFHGFFSIPIFCDMQTVGAMSGKRGWMTIQRRINGKVNFDRGWADYLQGFGFPSEEHWIGLRNILRLTQQRKIGRYGMHSMILRIDVEDWDGITGYIEHDSFNLLSEEFDFKMHRLGKHNGTAELGVPLGYSLSSPFSTYDHNNDRRRSNACVQTQKGGWWFGSCFNINLNGIYSFKKEVMSKNKAFIQNWKKINPNNTAFRYISIKLQ